MFDFDDAPALFRACTAHGVEGLMLKQLSAPYLPGKRTTAWRKVKCAEWAQHRERRLPALTVQVPVESQRGRVAPRAHLPALEVFVMDERKGMDRRAAVGIAAAIAAGAATILLVTASPAVGKHSDGQPHEKFTICHYEPGATEGKTIKVTDQELAEHAGHEQDTGGKCPKG